jgi:DNA-binding response OmpR family regulator/signal transduction histidine kinase
MDVAAGHGHGADANSMGWWAVERTVSPSHSSMNDTAVVSAELIQEYRVLASVAGTMQCGFLLLNQKERVTYFNASAVRLLGLQSRELIEEPVFDIRKQLLARSTEAERVRVELNYMWDHPDEETSLELALVDAAIRWLRVRSFPMRDAPGQLLGRGILIDDTTLEHTSLDFQHETLALAAHELKTPLAIIKGSATTLLSSSVRWDPAMQREMLQMIDTQADRLYDVLHTLLDVWRLDTGTQALRLSPLHIGELLRQLVERWQKEAPRHSFILHVPGDEPVIVCDAVRIEQAIQTLLSNAVKYAPSGGSIELMLESNDEELLLSVRDEGVGIAPEHLDRIFDRFYRVQQEGVQTGSGLGLSIARATIEAHGGKIWADSSGTGLGSTFHCVLPLTPQVTHIAHAVLPSTQKQAQQALFTQSSVYNTPSARITGSLKASERAYVLVAESDPRLTRYLRANLEEHQYRVQTVNHGVQFLRQLELEEPDLIMLATQLGDLSGIELLSRLREFSQTPLIMLSDDCDEDERVRLFDLGADDLVVKPFGMKELLARTRALLRRKPAGGQQETTQAVFSTGDLVIDYAQHQIWQHGRLVQLSGTEYKLLSVLAHNVGRVLTHEILLERVWGPEYNREVDFIWVYISRLRRKIEDDPRHPRYILTVPDVGYKLAKL